MVYHYLVGLAAPAYVLWSCAKKVSDKRTMGTQPGGVEGRVGSPGQGQQPSKFPSEEAVPKQKDSEMKSSAADEPKKSSNEKIEDNRGKWALRVIQMKCKTISQEFTEKVKKYQAPDMTSNAHNENTIKNRYTDVLCLDATRVVLKGKGKDDYIHGSWVTVPDGSTKYICTQGPLVDTLEDFWHMVFQEKTKFVIMLCNLVEGGAEKCALYWPEKKGSSNTYGAYKVTCTEIKPDPVEGVKWSILDVTHKSETFQVYHVFVTWWPDQLAPADPVPMVSLYKWVKKLNEKNTPILVHCSAGVGRTATFVGIDFANIRIKENPDVNLIDVIKEMRAQRYQSIQSHVQYLYLHICLLEYFTQEGCIVRDSRMTDFMEEYQRHAERKLAKRKVEEKDD